MDVVGVQVKRNVMMHQEPLVSFNINVQPVNHISIAQVAIVTLNVNGAVVSRTLIVFPKAVINHVPFLLLVMLIVFFLTLVKPVPLKKVVVGAKVTTFVTLWKLLLAQLPYPALKKRVANLKKEALMEAPLLEECSWSLVSLS